MGSRIARTASLTHSGTRESPRDRSCARGWLADICDLPAARRRRRTDARGAGDQARLGLPQLFEGGYSELAERLAPVALGGDHPRQPQDPKVPADEWLREAHARRELIHREWAVLRQQPDDSQARLVAKSAIESAEST